MSTLKTDELSNLAGDKTVPMGTVVDGSAKAWVNFNGTGTTVIRGAFNVSSITDNGVGDYAVNFISDMIDGSYATPVNIHSQARGNGVVEENSKTASSFVVLSVDNNGANIDGFVSLTVHR